MKPWSQTDPSGNKAAVLLDHLRSDVGGRWQIAFQVNNHAFASNESASSSKSFFRSTTVPIVGAHGRSHPALGQFPLDDDGPLNVAGHAEAGCRYRETENSTKPKTHHGGFFGIFTGFLDSEIVSFGGKNVKYSLISTR